MRPDVVDRVDPDAASFGLDELGVQPSGVRPGVREHLERWQAVERCGDSTPEVTVYARAHHCVTGLKVACLSGDLQSVCSTEESTKPERRLRVRLSGSGAAPSGLQREKPSVGSTSRNG